MGPWQRNAVMILFLNEFFLEAIDTMATPLYYRLMLHFETTLQKTVVMNILLFFSHSFSIVWVVMYDFFLMKIERYIIYEELGRESQGE